MPLRTGLEKLHGALASLAQQEVALNYALLDASGDAGVDSIVAAAGLRPAYSYYRTADGGQAAAIQEGWNNTAGSILGWLNADDRLLPGSLARVGRIFDTHPEIDIVYGQASYLDADGAFIGYFPAYAPDTARLDRSNTICQPAAFVRRSAVERIQGLNTSLHYTMDWDLWLRLRDAGCKFLGIDTVLAVVINDSNTKTNSGGGARAEEIAAILARRPRRPVERLQDWVGQAFGAAALAGRQTEWRLLSALLACKRGLSGAGRRDRLPGFRYGLQPLSNEVAGRCTVTLPVPPDQLPAQFSLFSDSSGPFRLSTDPAHPTATQMLVPQGRVRQRGIGGMHLAYKHVTSEPVTWSNPFIAGIEGPDRWRLVAAKAERL
ncbi:glycosyltransferase [Ferrovibrio sp. MS7]|uniref:glycosyltransferase n=1 Tax=Ferrovibrio plantarum TaxID=3119164 RepID=UPI0031376743